MMRIYHLETLDPTIVTQSGDDCDELYIGKMGAGCDCNYYRGLRQCLISDGEDSSTWLFPEGEGSFTMDNEGQYEGEIIGASWVMPDGTIVAQGVQLFSDEQVFDISGHGRPILFFIEVEPLTRYIQLDAYSNTWIGITGVSTSLMLILPTDIYQFLGVR